MNGKNVLVILNDEVDIVWYGKYGFIKDVDGMIGDTSLQDTGSGINFYRYKKGKWKRYERVLYKDCKIYSWFKLFKKTKQGLGEVEVKRILRRNL